MRSGQESLINPLLECETGKNVNNQELKILDTEIEKRINDARNNNKVGDVAVYFRDLNDGPWIGIHEDDTFFPASLVKIPILISYLKKSESEKEILTKKLTYDIDLGDSKTLG